MGSYRNIGRAKNTRNRWASHAAVSTRGLFVGIWFSSRLFSTFRARRSRHPPHSFRLQLLVPAFSLRIGSNNKTSGDVMALLSTIAGFSLFGLASRFGQLAIQKRNLMDSACFPSCGVALFFILTL
jgi:hypothetical protein